MRHGFKVSVYTLVALLGFLVSPHGSHAAAKHNHPLPNIINIVTDEIDKKIIEANLGTRCK